MKKKYIEFTEKGVVSVKTEDLDEGPLKDNEAIIRSEASVISSGTELAMLHGVESQYTFPSLPGYGTIGRIVAKGSGIDGFDIGERVFFAGKHASVQRFVHGSQSQYFHLFKAPEDLDPVVASVACMSEIAMTAPNVTELKLGDTVAVFGLGIVGIQAALLYKLRGAKVIALDPVKHRCELARKMGLECVIDVPAEEQVEAIMKLTGGKGADVAVDAAGHSAVIVNCIKAAALLGQVVVVGSPRAPYVADMAPVFLNIFRKGLVVRGAHMYRFPVQNQRGCSITVEWAFQVLFDLIRSGKLQVKNLISHVIKPEEAPSAYEGLLNRKDEYTCVVIDWRQG